MQQKENKRGAFRQHQAQKLQAGKLFKVSVGKESRIRSGPSITLEISFDRSRLISSVTFKTYKPRHLWGSSDDGGGDMTAIGLYHPGICSQHGQKLSLIIGFLSSQIRQEQRTTTGTK